MTAAPEKSRPTWPTPWLLAMAVAIGGIAARPAAAQEESSATEAPATEDASATTDVKLKELEIKGELEKPKIFFILPKAQRDAETRQRRIRFYPDILEPLDKDRFEEEARVLYQHGIPAE